MIRLSKHVILVYAINIILFYSTNTHVSAKNLNDLLYNTSSGVYEAKLVNVDSYDKFLPGSFVHKLVSVPYGEKPERFQPAKLRAYEKGVHKNTASVFCFQSVNITAYGLFSLNEAPKMSEDCLRINLFIPVSKTAQLKSMPVIVHVHGGSNMVGGASLFDGSILASHGKVIVAVINFRLSILGRLVKNIPDYSYA